MERIKTISAYPEAILRIARWNESWYVDQRKSAAADRELKIKVVAFLLVSLVLGYMTSVIVLN